MALRQSGIVVLLVLMSALASACTGPEPTEIALSAPTGSPCSDDVAGEYSGRLLNETLSEDSEILVRIEQSGCVIEGNLTVFPPLAGSGEFSGSLANGTINFTVQTMFSGFSGQIIFQGILDDSTSLSGGYEVPPWALGNSDAQTGRWELTPTGPTER